ncbi:DUF3808 domain-containing protein [bacterium]|nr:DUF3808 domain-containing protein [bacterium]
MVRFTAALSLLLFFSPVLAQHDKALEVLDEAVTLLNKGRYNDAYLKFSEGIRIDKSNGELHYGKANAAYNLNLLDTAITEVQIAMEIEGKESKLYNLLGNIHFRSRQFDEAVQAFTQAINLNAVSQTKINLLNCYYNRGSCLLMLKEYKEAEPDFSKAIEENPKFAEAYHNRAICYLRTGEQEKACADIRKAISLGSPRSQKYLKEACNE